MFDAMQVSATGMRAHETQINTISQNVANMNTVGYRRQLVSFAEVSMDTSGLLSGDKLDKVDVSAAHGAGSLALLSLSNRAGELKQTDEVLDVAIDGAGFFEVQRTDGSVAYTRAGNLQVDASGNLQTQSGDTLTAQINIPTGMTALKISADGKVIASIDGKGETELGQIELITFGNPAALLPVGDNLYVATEKSGELQAGIPGESGLGTLRQGFLESSNVQMVDELVSLMIAQRAFEMNSRIAQAADQIQSITNGLIR